MKTKAAAILFSTGGLLLCLPAIDAPFLYDDFHSIVDNPSVRSLRNARSFFTDKETFTSLPVAGSLRPLLLLTYSLNYAISGYDTWSWHLANGLFHGLNAWLVFLLARRFLPRPRDALVSGALFLVHPLASEPLFYVSSRSSSLAAFWFLAAVLAAIEGTLVWEIAAIVFFSAALLTKATAIALPAILILLRFSQPKRERTAPSGRIIVASIVIAIVFFLFVGHGLVESRTQAASGIEGNGSGPLRNLLLQSKSCFLYLRIAAVPLRQSFFHEVTPHLAGLFVAFHLAFVSLGLFSRSGIVRTGILWFYITLAPTSSLVSLNIVAAERRAYLPLAGLALLPPLLLRRIPCSSRSKSALATLTITLLAGLTIHRGNLFAEPERLFRESVGHYPASFLAHAALGSALARAGHHQSALGELDEASRLAPRFVQAPCEKARILARIGRTIEAEETFRTCLLLNPDNPEAMVALASLLARRGAPPEAARLLQQTTRLRPKNPATLATAASLAADMGMDAVAATFAKRLRRIEPGSVDLVRLEARNLASTGHRTAAIRTLEDAYAKSPSLPLALDMARLDSHENRYDRAAGRLIPWLDQSPDSLPLLLSLGNAYLELGKTEKALSLYRKARRLAPASWQVAYNLGLACERMGEIGPAIDAFDAAARTAPPGRRQSIAARRSRLLARVK